MSLILIPGGIIRRNPPITLAVLYHTAFPLSTNGDTVFGRGNNMAKVILICGKICSGKTTYAERIKISENAIVLSSDDAVLRLFGHYLGDEHERIAEKVEKYLLDQSLNILATGTSVILDWGFWTKKERQEIYQFYCLHGYTPTWHYITVTDSVWTRNIQTRNRLVVSGQLQAFHIDTNLMLKFQEMFEEPDPSEMNQIIENT